MPLKTLLKRYPLPVSRREIVHESCYIDHLHKSLRFLVPIALDIPLIARYLSETHNDHWPFLLSQPLNSLIDQKMTILATDYFEVCGVIVAHIKEVDPELVGEGRVDGNRRVKVVCVELLQAREEYEEDDRIKRQLLIECIKRAAVVAKTRYVIFSANKQMIQELKMDTKNVDHLHEILSLNNGSDNENLMLIDLSDSGDLLNAKSKMPLAYKVDSSLRRRCMKRFTPKRLNRELKVEIALPEDEPVFKHFMLNEFMRRTPINTTLQLNEAESLEHYNTRIDFDQFQKGLCLMITDEGRICAAGTCKPIEAPLAQRQLQPIRIPMDLKQESDSIPMSSQRARQAQAICNWMTAFVSQYLPHSCERYMRIEMRSVHPYYVRCGIAGAITDATDQVIREHGYEYFQTLYLAHAMTRIVEGKEAYPPAMIRYPYSQFFYNGQQIIPGGLNADDGEYVSINVGPVRGTQNNGDVEERPAAKL